MEVDSVRGLEETATKLQRPVTHRTQDLLGFAIVEAQDFDELLQDGLFAVTLLAVGMGEQRGVGEQKLAVFFFEIAERYVGFERAPLLRVLEDFDFFLGGRIEAGEQALDDTTLPRFELPIGPGHRNQRLYNVFLRWSHGPHGIQFSRAEGTPFHTHLG